MSSAREELLARVRHAIRDAPAAVELPRSYRRSGTLDAEGRVALLCERIRDYRAEVRRVSEEELPATIAAAFDSRGANRIAVPPGLPAGWRPPGAEVVEDDGLSSVELDGVDGALTGCTLAIAETGTLVLTAGAAEGRRALTLVPDLHVCVVRADQVVELVPEALESLAGDPAGRSRPITLVSGPSATSDIELNRVEGVHGPRTLVVLVTSQEPS